MKQHKKPLRDTWHKGTNVSQLAPLCTRRRFALEVQEFLQNCLDKPLQERINYRADLWVSTFMAGNFGYGNGNRAKRRVYKLWQAGRITAAQLLDADMQLL